MNKHQEALAELKKQLVVVDYLDGKAVSQEPIFEEQTEILQELVNIYPEYLELKERATPKKPIYESKLMRYGYRCPICRWFVEDDFCKNCGQKLDWSE